MNFKIFVNQADKKGISLLFVDFLKKRAHFPVKQRYQNLATHDFKQSKLIHKAIVWTNTGSVAFNV